MCGVIGFICERTRSDLGRLAADLLRTLEYRGYDSTGAAFQGDGDEVVLLKSTGAPSTVVHRLGIVEATGRIFCGQVRWATFGAVDDRNAQPHEVACRVPLYGAHNGNITNSDDLQTWLQNEHHRVASDNDGEMVVHTIEHLFAAELEHCDRESEEARRAAMRRALKNASSRFRGSFAAVIVDPKSATIWAQKSGSSLYFGHGHDEHGAFRIASSDLSTVLRLTQSIVPLREGEFVEYRADRHQVYSVTDASPILRDAVPSRLRAQDAALRPPFSSFMEQEIAAQAKSARDLIALASGGTPQRRVLEPHIDARPESELTEIIGAFEDLAREAPGKSQRAAFHSWVDRRATQALLEAVPEALRRSVCAGARSTIAEHLVSNDASLLGELLEAARDDRDVLAVRILDVLLEREEAREIGTSIDRFADACEQAIARGHRIDWVCCGSSFHAARAGAMFMSEIARIPVDPALPGDFRATRAHTLQDGDVLVAVSQSGETKDLIDILNAVEGSRTQVVKLAIVNNVNSTLAQEKCSVAVPVRCGPEVAVPATKSFMNQLVLFFILAVRIAEKRRTVDPEVDSEIARHRARLSQIPELLTRSTTVNEPHVEAAAEDLFLAPSIHILATRMSAVADEGALKIREVVLNHTQGYEASEFKHGPNTILGFNTVFGPPVIARVLHLAARRAEDTLAQSEKAALGPDGTSFAVRSCIEALFTPHGSTRTERPSSAGSKKADHAPRHDMLETALSEDYPLVYITGPEERDVALTISQINTHKIRGARTVIIAEENARLRQAAEKPPKDHPGYRSAYIALPPTNDTLLTVFSATVVLQRLALKMSVKKGRYLDELGLKDHGVHPDVPKNVSKSITVD